MLLSFDDCHMMCNQYEEVTQLLVDKVFKLFWLVVQWYIVLLNPEIYDVFCTNVLSHIVLICCNDV